MIDTRMRQYVFLALAVGGIIATWYFNILHMNEYGGFSVSVFVADARANSAAISIFNDLFVVVLLFLFWSYYEAKRLKMRFWPMYVVLTFGIAIAFSFPLFMFMRERRLASVELQSHSA